MKIELKNNGYVKHAELFLKTVGDRIPLELEDGGMVIELKIDSSIAKAESFSICGEGKNCKSARSYRHEMGPIREELSQHFK
jgi:hypothetical protein